MKPRAIIREQLRLYQRRLQLGDPLPPITELARRAGLHRDTVYACLQGDRLDDRSWRQLYSALEQIADSLRGVPSRVMSLQLTAKGITLKTGLGRPLLKSG